MAPQQTVIAAARSVRDAPGDSDLGVMTRPEPDQAAASADDSAVAASPMPARIVPGVRIPTDALIVTVSR